MVGCFGYLLVRITCTYVGVVLEGFPGLGLFGGGCVAVFSGVLIWILYDIVSCTGT